MSDKPGGGLRYNEGKPQFEFIPWGVLYAWAGAPHYDAPARARLAAKALASWEFGRASVNDAISIASWGDLEQAAHALAYGADKYSDWNWALGMKWSVPSACAKRHFGKAVLATSIAPKGEWPVEDSESGVSHLGHFWCNVIMLAHFENHYREGDDRPVAQLPGVPFNKDGVAQGSRTVDYAMQQAAGMKNQLGSGLGSYFGQGTRGNPLGL